MIKFENKKGQLAIYIIVALVIVGAIVAVVILRGNFLASGPSLEFKPIFDHYSDCVEQNTKDAIDLAGNQGGRIYLDDYVPGSEYAPSASQLNFLGYPVPYWYYLTGNGLIKEQVPSKTDIENEIERYIEEKIGECDFESFYAQGYDIKVGAPKAKVQINEKSIDVQVDTSISASKGDQLASQNSYKVSVNSQFGKFYALARGIYNKEKTEAFLENYSADVIRLYAPVDGVDISCAPKIWKSAEVADQIKQGLEANIASLKLNGNYYTLKDKRSKYFVVDLATDSAVNFIYSQKWPSKIEINGEGVDQDLMVAEPVGNQEGLGIMGFCYTPYHYVYDLSYPVMVQIYNNEEIFQFPVVVIVDKNMPREGIKSTISEDSETDFCQYYNQDIVVNIYDNNLNRVNGNISYICFNQQCRLGESVNGQFVGKAPACVNGYIQVRTEGYTENKQLFSSNSESSVDVILDKEYDVDLNLIVGGRKISDSSSAVVSFAGSRTVSAVFPDSKSIKLSEGMYNVSVYVYGNSSIVIPANTKRECRDIPKAGILGIFGGTREQCFDINVPETKIDQGLIGGGKSEIYLLASELEKGNMSVNVEALPRPDSLEKLQYNFESFDKMGVEVEFT